ncbi:protein ALP1-like [Aphis craccivora]|uniref:Protein ALP1-like n=1 Tax=Aphis craccivora TaxID=307492 RepID=A0A6G0VZ91_APHCR|nr:protein ALP1-like [Aphis craccivora]
MPKKGGVLPLVPIFASLSALGARVLYNYELITTARLMKIRHFIGVCTRDKLSSRPKRIESAIINLTSTHCLTFLEIYHRH